MPRHNLHLTVTDRQFTATPLPGPTALRCTAADGCRNLATHRLLMAGGSASASVELLCDEHMLLRASEHGLQVTTARLPTAVAG